MISVQEARRLILEHAVPLPAERTALLEALGRTVASPVTASAAHEDVPAGGRVLEAGMILTPARVALLASLGRSHVTVHAPARVAILTTSDELVDPGTPLKAGQRYNANAFAMTAMVAEAGAVPIRMAVAGDDKAQAVKALQKALRFDAVIAVGDVTEEASGLLGEAISQLGTLLFREVAQQPGQPLTFGLALGRPIFGLPGHPASAMTAFEYFVRPALRKMMGHRSQDRPRVIATMRDAFVKEPGRQAFVEAHVEQTADGYVASLAGGPEAGQLRSMASANGLVIVPAAADGFQPGAELETILLTPAELCGMACLPLGGDQTVSRLATMIGPRS